MAEKFSEEKLMALAVAEINAKRSAFYCAEETFILSATELNSGRLLTTGTVTQTTRARRRCIGTADSSKPETLRKLTKSLKVMSMLVGESLY